MELEGRKKYKQKEKSEEQEIKGRSKGATDEIVRLANRGPLKKLLARKLTHRLKLEKQKT